MLRTLSFSYCFPNRVNATWGVFVQQRLAAMGKLVDLEVVSPAPTFPLVGRLRGWPGPKREEWRSLTVHRPRFLCFPGVLKSYDARLYARGLSKWMQDYARQWQPDLLDAHFVWPDGVGVSLLARQLRIPYTITLRGKLYPCLKIPAQREQCALALRNATAVISVDERMARIACELGAERDRICVIPNGVDLERFQPGDRSEARRSLGLPLDGQWLVTVAHLGKRKGHYEVIRALASLPSDVRLVLVGGDSSNGSDTRRLQHLIHKLGVQERVILAGRQPHERIPLYYQAADVSVLASWREGCPNVVLESLACGTPVVATDVGSVPEMINIGVNGQIVPVQAVEELTQAIGTVLNCRPSVQEVRACPAVRSWHDVAKEAISVLEAALDKPTEGRAELPNGNGQLMQGVK